MQLPQDVSLAASPIVPSQPRVGFFGVNGVDRLLGNGISYEMQVMLQGDTGIGKSILAAQFLYEGLQVGDTCIYIAIDEPPDVMRQNMAFFRLGSTVYERLGQLILVDAFNRHASKERYSLSDPTNFDEFFLNVRKIIDACTGPIRLVADSLSTIFATASLVDILNFNSARLRYLRGQRVLTLDSFVTGVLDQRTVAGLSHAYPMILRMSYDTGESSPRRYFQLGKLKSGQFTAARNQFYIDSRTGIVAVGQKG